MRYAELVDVYQKLSQTSKRLEKTYHISQLLKKTPSDEIPRLMLLLEGKVYPAWGQKEIGVGSKLVAKAINVATGIPSQKIQEEWRKTGDLGQVAENLIKVKKQATLFQRSLDVKTVFDNLRKLVQLAGTGSVDQKIKLVAELLTSAQPTEAKYIVRTVLEELRVGVGEGSIRDAVVWAFFGQEIGVIYDHKTTHKVVEDENREKYNSYVSMVQHAYDLTNDFSKVARICKQSGVKGLKEVQLEPGVPVKVMLYQKAENLKEAFERVGKPAAVEFKYDGFRVQIHKYQGKIQVFTRRLEDVTAQFPEVVEYVGEFVEGKSFILDCEAVGYDPKTEKYLPFQNISQRIKRKYHISRMSRDFPVEVNVFDIMYYHGENTISQPFKQRRKLLEKIVKEKQKKIILAKQLITRDLSQAESFYSRSLQEGEEGVMVKNLQGVYKPGSRVGYGVKVKPVMESLDLVIVGAEWGEGKRAKWLTSYTVACIDQDNNLLEVGKVGTGIKELEAAGQVTFPKMTEMLRPLVTAQERRSVKLKPEVVMEVTYGEIQKSPTYKSGFALRFPRAIRLRPEKGAKDCSTLEQVKTLYQGQRK